MKQSVDWEKFHHGRGTGERNYGETDFGCIHAQLSRIIFDTLRKSLSKTMRVVYFFKRFHKLRTLWSAERVRNTASMSLG